MIAYWHDQVSPLVDFPTWGKFPWAFFLLDGSGLSVEDSGYSLEPCILLATVVNIHSASNCGEGKGNVYLYDLS